MNYTYSIIHQKVNIMTYNITKIVMLTALIISTTMSGCIEFRDVNESGTTTIESIYMAHEIPDYLKNHNISVNLGDMQVTIHTDKTITVNNETGIWFPSGINGDTWTCCILDIEDIEYVDLHDGRMATGRIDDITINGVWFR